MLFDTADFERISKDPNVVAEIDKIEAQYGSLDKRMMIREGNVPTELAAGIDPLRPIQVFVSSFDDTKAGFGIAFYRDKFELAASAWINFDDEKDTSQFPSEDQLELLLGVLTNQHAENKLSTPMYTFYNDEQVYTVVS